MKKTYIKPITAKVKTLQEQLLAGSGINYNGQTEDGGAKEHNGWSFDEDDSGTNAWGDSFSAWE